MPHQRYSKLASDDNEDCDTDTQVMAVLKQLRLYRILFIVVIVLNLCFIGAWLRSSSNDCTRPQLVYSKLIVPMIGL